MADPKHVFISYAREDRNRVANLANLLEAEGWPVWWDRENLPAGQKFHRVIDQAIQDAACVLVCWSAAALDSDWVIDEAEEAKSQNKLLPVMLEAVKPPYGFRSYHYIDLSDWDDQVIHAAYHRLKAELTSKQIPKISGTETPQTAKPGDSKAEAFPSNIQALIDRLENPETEPEQRLAIGDELARLRDPRPGVGLDRDGLPDIDWVEILGGEFLYGEDQQTRHFETFFIARYPITNAQYQAFIDDGGYKNERWWQGLAAHPEPQNPEWNQSNRPRETVSWYETIAYCRWLSDRLGYAVELPDESQWQRAASGATGRAWPWGEAYRPGYANVNETREKAGAYNLEQTSAVGIYPQGASAEGVHELSGNVWEWCLNEHENPENIALEGAVPRVLRGGSWYYNPDLARAADRYRFNPDDRDFDIGFRVVCSSPIKR